MGLRDWLTGGPPVYRSALLRPPEQKAQFIDGYQVALTNTMLVHGPGVTDALRGAGDGNSAVFACLAAIAEGYIEAPLRVWRQAAPGQKAPLPRHPLQALLDRPNPFMSALELWAWVQWAKHLDGNAYLRKVRANGPGTNVVELWPISPTRMTVIGTARTFISEYAYTVAPGKVESIAPADILHFRLGLDDRDHRLGLAPLKRLLRAIATDDRAAEWTDTLLANGAMMSMVVSTEQELQPDQAQQLQERAQALYGGANRGKVGVLGKGATAKQMGFSPEQMLLEKLHHIPESRIAAVLRVPPIVAGLGVGLAQSTYSNYGQARAAFVENTLTSLWAADAAKVQTQLLSEFTAERNIVVAHDLSDVRAFQDAEASKFQRLHQAVGGPWMTPNEARAEAGMLPIPDGDVLFVPVNMVPTPVDDLQAPPAPALPPPVTHPGPTDAPVPLRAVASRRARRGIAPEDLAAAAAFWRDDPTVGAFLGAGRTGTEA